MSQTIYLCKVKKQGKTEYLFLYNETPKYFFNNLKKTLKDLKRNYPELLECYPEELLEYESKSFEVITVNVEASNLIRNIREKIENRQYKYENQEYLDDVHKCPYSRHLFGIIRTGIVIEKNEVDVLKRLIDNTDEIVILKRIIGKYLFHFYIYNPKSTKYSDIVERIKLDFSEYHQKNNFYIWKKDKRNFISINSYQGQKKDVNLDKIRSSYFLNTYSLELKQFDLSWLKTKINLDIDMEKLSKKEYIDELKSIFNSKSKIIVETNYEDFSSRSIESLSGNNDSDEVILFSKEQKKIMKDHKNKQIEKYGNNFDELYIEIYAQTKEIEDTLIESKKNNANIIRHIIKKGKNILLDEFLFPEDVPFWVEVEISDEL